MGKIREAQQQAQDIIDEVTEKGGTVGRAISVAVLVFFFSVFLFIGIVVLFVTLANKIGPGGGQ